MALCIRVGVRTAISGRTRAGSSATTAPPCSRPSVFNFAPNGNEAALWNSGGAPAADAQGNIFVSLANGTFDTTLNAQGFPSRGDYGNAFVKLTPQNGSLAPTDYWTMDNTVSESNHDVDLGSGGIMLLPDMLDAAGQFAIWPSAQAKTLIYGCSIATIWANSTRRRNATIYQELTGHCPAASGAIQRTSTGRYISGPLAMSSAHSS